jgi:hypothetical protein
MVDEIETLEYSRQHWAAFRVPRSVKSVRPSPKANAGKILRRQGTPDW